MKKIFFLVNNLDENNFLKYTKIYLKNIEIRYDVSLPSKTNDYDLIILWNYKKILKEISNKNNFILFHGSDLPEGKGWAPIYYSIVKGLPYYTISGILPADEVDAGDILVKARFEIKDNHTAEFIRKCDDEISVILIQKILEKFTEKPLKGKKQSVPGTKNNRRNPEDNEIDTNSKFKDMIDHLRGCESSHPAFFYLNEQKFFISITPEKTPTFPEDLEITFFDE